jgi:hypothetical protein
MGTEEGQVWWSQVPAFCEHGSVDVAWIIINEAFYSMSELVHFNLLFCLYSGYNASSILVKLKPSPLVRFSYELDALIESINSLLLEDKARHCYLSALLFSQRTTRHSHSINP